MWLAVGSKGGRYLFNDLREPALHLTRRSVRFGILQARLRGVGQLMHVRVVRGATVSCCYGGQVFPRNLCRAQLVGHRDVAGLKRGRLTTEFPIRGNRIDAHNKGDANDEAEGESELRGYRHAV